MSIVVRYNIFKDLAYVCFHTITFMGNCGHANEFLHKVDSWTSHPYRIQFSHPLLQLEEQKFSLPCE
jgi:hypothetical protein